MTLIFSKYGPNLPRRAAVVQDTLERVRALPQVISASSIHFLPTNSTSGTGYDRADRPLPPPGERKGGDVSVVSSDYFRTMGIPVIAGREFDRGDRMGSPPVAVLVARRRECSSAKPLRIACGATGRRSWHHRNIRHHGLNTEPSPLSSCATCKRRTSSRIW
jgi:hypothetical protein